MQAKRVSRLDFAYYLFLSAAVGAAVLGLEVLAARTMAPVLGSGPVVWASVLAVALGTLAAGNLIGGFLVGKISSDRPIVCVLAVASVTLVVFSQIYSTAMNWCSGFSIFASAILGSSFSQLVPMLMLGITTPLVLHLNPLKSRPGVWHGLVLACGSLGGIVGSLCAGVFFLPAFGLSRSYLLIAALLTFTAFPVLLARHKWMQLSWFLTVLALIFVCWIYSREAGVVQSRYAEIRLAATDRGTALLIDGIIQTGFAPGMEKWKWLEHGYLLEAALFYRPGITNALVVGLGAGLAPRILRKRGIDCECVEIDPKVVEFARNPFGYSGPVIAADGRTFLRKAERHWDLIILDVCTSERLPWHLFTVEALRIARERLSPNGILAVQFIGDGGDWSQAVCRTVREVFNNAITVVSRGQETFVGPRWLFASSVSLTLPDDVLERTETAEFLEQTEIEDLSGNTATSGSILTDDHFPAELEWSAVAHEWRRTYAYLR